MHIYQANIEDAEDQAHIKTLFEEYLYWANDQLDAHFGIRFDIPQMIEGDMATLGKFAPPDGRLLLAKDDEDVVGLACMRKIRPDVAEIKRMYVRPSQRRQGVGQALVARTVTEARTQGYDEIYLDSARFMQAAHGLYRACGFLPFEEYPESEIPPEFREHWLFMRLPLA